MLDRNRDAALRNGLIKQFPALKGIIGEANKFFQNFKGNFDDIARWLKGQTPKISPEAQVDVKPFNITL